MSFGKSLSTLDFVKYGWQKENVQGGGCAETCCVNICNIML